MTSVNPQLCLWVGTWTLGLDRRKRLAQLSGPGQSMIWLVVFLARNLQGGLKKSSLPGGTNTFVLQGAAWPLGQLHLGTIHSSQAHCFHNPNGYRRGFRDPRHLLWMGTGHCRTWKPGALFLLVITLWRAEPGCHLSDRCAHVQW